MTWRHSEWGYLGAPTSEDRDGEGQVQAEQSHHEVEPSAVEGQPDDGQQEDDDQSGVSATLGVADEGDDGHVADRDHQPGEVGQALPRHEEGGRQEPDEDDGRHQDLAREPRGERDEADEDGAHALPGRRAGVGPAWCP